MDSIAWLILFILAFIGIMLFSGWCISKGIEYEAKAYAKAFVDELEKRIEKQKKKHEERFEKKRPKNQLWLCPICGEWQEEPATHLKEVHNVSDDMIQFWIEKGRWL